MPKEAKLLRRELVRVTVECNQKDIALAERDAEIAAQAMEIAELKLVIQARDAALAERDEKIAELDAIIAELAKENAALGRHIHKHENCHVPSGSNNSRWQGNKNASRAAKKSQIEAEAGGEPVPKPENPPGHPLGTPSDSHHNKSEEVVHCRPGDECDGCGGTDVVIEQDTVKQVTRLVSKPVIKIITYVSYIRRCKCGRVHSTRSEIPSIEGTSFDYELVDVTVHLWDKYMSEDKVRESLDDLYGIRVTKSTVKQTLKAASKKLEAEQEKIVDDIKNKAVALNADETTYWMPFSLGYVWLVVGRDARGRIVGVYIIPEETRAGTVIDDHFPLYDKLITVDGYAAYGSRFKKLQRCWSHILREARDEAKRGGACELLYRKLRDVYDRAKDASAGCGPWGGDADAAIRDLEARVAAIVGQYKDLGVKFGTTLENAAPDLFTFVRHPIMDPTNNRAERILRAVVLHRRMRFRFVTKEGAGMFGVLMTCLMTWREMGLDTHQRMLEVLRGP